MNAIPSAPPAAPRGIPAWLLIFGLLAVVSCSGSDDSGRSEIAADDDRPNIVLVTLDTVRADRLRPWGYDRADTPRLDALAAEGVVFEHVISPVPLTVPAHASMLTGAYPFQLGARTNESKLPRDGFDTVADVLGDAGYACAAFIGAVQLDSLHGLDRGFEVYDDAMGPEGSRLVERRAEAVVSSFTRWLKAHDDGRPFFAWIHFYDPHEPYEAPAAYRKPDRDPYDEEITYCDAQVGVLLDAIRATRSPRDLVTIVTSDHGEGLGDHGESTHGLFLYGATVDIPLIVHAPDRFAQGKRVAERVRLVDVAPTVLEIAGELEPGDRSNDPRLPARSLVPALRSDGSIVEQPAFAESIYAFRVFGYHPVTALVDGGFKVIDSPEPELYDLRSDPRESVNLADHDPERLTAMLGNLRDLMERYGVGDTEFAEIDAERRNQLLELGYIVGELDAGTPQTLSPDGLPDVKTILPFLEDFEAAVRRLRDGDPRFAEAIVDTLREHRPKSPYIYRQMLQQLRGMKANDAAFEVLRMLVDVTPEASIAADPRAHLQLGYAWLERKRAGEAQRVFQAILERAPEQIDALAGLGQVHLNLSQDHAAALRVFETFLEHAPASDARRAQIESVVRQLRSR